MRFKDYFFGLPVAERESFAQRAGTTRGYLNQVAYGNKQIELGLADVLVALADGVTLDELPLTDNARRQRAIREEATPSPIPVAASPAHESTSEVPTAAENRRHIDGVGSEARHTALGDVSISRRERPEA